MHVLDKYGIETKNVDDTIDLVQRATHLKKKALYEDELRLIAQYPDQVSAMLWGPGAYS